MYLTYILEFLILNSRKIFRNYDSKNDKRIFYQYNAFKV